MSVCNTESHVESHKPSPVDPPFARGPVIFFSSNRSTEPQLLQMMEFHCGSGLKVPKTIVPFFSRRDAWLGLASLLQIFLIDRNIQSPATK